MSSPHDFDYDQPSRDALAGSYVEVSDCAPETPAAELPASQDKSVVAQTERLFGLTLSVGDAASAEPLSRKPQE